MPSFNRRRLLTLLPAATLLPRAGAIFDDEPERKLKVIITGGHPGDPEYGCGGVAARYADLGHDVTLLYLNRGERQCPEPENGVRVGEARKACSILKARAVFARQCDGKAVIDDPRYAEFRELLSAQKPDIVFTHWPVDGHRDHRAISMMTLDAWFRGGKTFSLYYYEVSNGEDTFLFQPTDYVDISSVESRKRAACYAHASQAPDKYYALQDQVARFRGLDIRCERAEAFIHHPRSGPQSGLLPR